MPTLPSSAGALRLTATGADAAPEPDPELIALPSPPRGARTMTVVVLASAAVAALAMTYALSREVGYAFTSGSPATLGDLRAVSAAALEANENRLVRGDALVGAAGGIGYERPFVDDSFRMLPVAGRVTPLDMWVEVRVPSGQDNGRWEPPHSFTGRLLRFDAAGPRNRGLRDAIEEATGEHLPPGAWLLIDGEEPRDMRWAVVLAVMFLGFVAFNGVSIARIVRKVK